LKGFEHSSDEDENGNLKPSRKPFEGRGVTFDYSGKLLKLKAPKFKMIEPDIQNRIKIKPEPEPARVKKTPVVFEPIQGGSILNQYGSGIQSQL
jgi:hypothetical protein